SRRPRRRRPRNRRPSPRNRSDPPRSAAVATEASMIPTRRLPLFFVPPVLALAVPAAAQELDTVYLSNGSTETGKVLESTRTGLTFQPEKGAKKPVPWE